MNSYTRIDPRRMTPAQGAAELQWRRETGARRHTYSPAAEARDHEQNTLDPVRAAWWREVARICEAAP